ncbi:MAG: hypothetical protein ACI90V_002125 [Bacillariaceae sp.]|jgi:hypothetical protein
MRRTLLLFELLVLGLCLTVRRCHGRRAFHQIRRFWKIRGGESSSYSRNYAGPDLPPDLPNYGDDGESEEQRIHRQQGQEQYQYNNPQQQQQQQQQPGGDPGADFRYSQQSHDSNSQYHSQQQQGPYSQQQQQQQSPPNLPPGAYGTDNGPPPLHPGYQQQRQYPSLPDDSSIFAEDDEIENMSMDSAFGGDDSLGGGDNPNNGGGMDLSSFDKEYILKGLARLYRKKILPLEISSRYGHFHSPPLSPADFVAPPQVLLLGQYR